MTPSDAGRTALVLGGGGITGIAWETGLIVGLADAGVDLTTADLVVGTSAGSVVGAQVTSGVPLAELWERQLAPVEDGPVASVGAGQIAAFGVALLRARGDLTTFGARVGGYALGKSDHGGTPDQQQRLDAIAERLPVHEWPECDLRVCVVDAVLGERHVLDGDSGFPFVDSVAASCAVPGVYPPVDLGGHPYIDGGMHSAANVDVASGYDRVVVIAPLAAGIGPMRSARDQLDDLRAPHAILVTPDEGAKQAIGRNVLDPAARPPSARAGRAQAATIADQVRAVWHG
ncbi:patatin-like phospholipase family protein [Solicola sp. PLA-1-18]|uniref:patatin-like phospholipase family protein n=1 Tax=Solicola sp. PLA-1-18 TaxID=3380532 RepID=UPI003B786673